MSDNNTTNNTNVTPDVPEMILIQGKKGSFWAKKSECTTIKCATCGAERTIKLSDQFHTFLCVACKKKEEQAARNLKNKAKNAAKSEAKRAEELRQLLTTLSDEQIAQIRAGEVK